MNNETNVKCWKRRDFTLIELLVETACFSGDSAVDQGMGFERGEMR